MRAAVSKTLLRPSAIAAAVLVALGLVFLVGGLRLGLWVDGGPGPGLLPACAAVLLLGLIALMTTGIAKEEEGFKAAPLVAIGLCGAFAVLAPLIGILVPTFLLVFAWVKLLYGQSWSRAAMLGVGLTACAIALFHVLLKVPVPLIAGVP